MPPQNIELSQQGIKISYHRLLSDSAAGLFFYFILFIIYYFPVFGVDLKSGFNLNLPSETRIAFLIALALLVSPVGLAINSISWMCFGGWQTRYQEYWFGRNNFVMKAIEKEFCFLPSNKYFNIAKENWYHRSQLVKHTLGIYHPEAISAQEHLRGIRTFLRNISFLLCLFSITLIIARSYFFLISKITWCDLGFGIMICAICLLFSWVFILMTSLLGVYYTSQILAKTHILCRAMGRKEDFAGDDAEIHYELIEMLSKEQQNSKKSP